MDRRTMAAAALLTGLALTTAGVASTPDEGVAIPRPSRPAEPAISAILGTGTGERHVRPESLRERLANETWMNTRFGAPLDVDVVAARLAAWTRAQSMPVTSPGKGWREMGPDPYIVDDPAYGLRNAGLDRSAGRVTELAADPSDRTGRTVWAGTAGGGVWLTRDAGKTWTPKSDTLPSLIVGAIAVDPADPNTVYLGTGDNATGGGHTFPGVGVFVTRDAGATWSRPAANLRDAATVYSIEVAGGRVFVASNKGLFRSTDGGRSFHDVRLPTNTAGVAPSKSRLGNVVTDVVAHPDNPQQITAVVGWRKGRRGTPKSEGNGLYRSEKGGAPGTFTRMNSSGLGTASKSDDPIARTDLAYASGPGQDHDVLWAIVQDAGVFAGETYLDAPILLPSVLNGVYRSGDDGATWEVKATPESFQAAPGTGLILGAAQLYQPGSQAWFNLYISVDPADADRVIVGMEEIYQSSANANGPGLAEWKTIGRYWNTCALRDEVDCSAVGGPYAGKVTTHPDQHGIAWARTADGYRMWVGNDGGVYYQDPKPSGYDNDSWVTTNVGLRTLQFYYAVMGKDGVIYGGLQDNGTAKILPNGTGYEVFGGDGGDVAVHPANSDWAFEEYVFGDIRKTADGGRTWTDIAPAVDGAQFITPFEMDALNPDHLVLGAKQVVETTKGIQTTCAFDDTTVTFFKGTTCDWTIAYDLGDSNGNPNTTSGLDIRGGDIYVAFCGVCDVLTAGGGDPNKFHNGIATNVKDGCEPQPGTNACWHKTAAKGLPRRYVSDVAIDPDNRKTIFVTLNVYSRKWYTPEKNWPGVGEGQVYVSRDAGETFHNVTANLPDIPANAALVRGDSVYVANDMGVYVAPKAGGAWSRLGTGLPNAAATDLNLNPQGDKLVVATYGRGIWVYDFGAAAKPAPKPAPKVGGVKRRRDLPATGLDPATALGVLLVAAAAALWRRSRTFGT